VSEGLGMDGDPEDTNPEISSFLWPSAAFAGDLRPHCEFGLEVDGCACLKGETVVLLLCSGPENFQGELVRTANSRMERPLEVGIDRVMVKPVRWARA